MGVRLNTKKLNVKNVGFGSIIALETEQERELILTENGKKIVPEGYSAENQSTTTP